MGHLSNIVSHPYSKEALKNKAVKQCVGFAVGNLASMAVSALPMILAGINSSQAAQDRTTKHETETETLTVVTTKTDDEIKEEVKNILTDNHVEINENHLDDIIKKYNAMKAVNPDITDAEVSRRVTNYAKALVRNDQKQQIVDADPNDDATYELKVVDTDMTPEVMTDQNKYLQALYNRGEGELSMYDLNGDNEVTEDEFIEVETGSTKTELLKTTEGTADLTFVSNSFRKIDFNNDGKLTADEFGAAEYASYRLYDYLNEDGEFVETDVQKTGNELSYDEIIGSTAILTGVNNDINDPERKEFGKLQKGAYNLLKNYKPQ